jgi:hypothetical protein
MKEVKFTLFGEVVVRINASGFMKVVRFTPFGEAAVKINA